MHVGNSGIQAHSAGSIFPYTIVVQGSGPGNVHAMHGGTGERLSKHPFLGFGPQGDFRNAHINAELDAALALMAGSAPPRASQLQAA